MSEEKIEEPDPSPSIRKMTSLVDTLSKMKLSDSDEEKEAQIRKIRAGLPTVRMTQTIAKELPNETKKLIRSRIVDLQLFAGMTRDVDWSLLFKFLKKGKGKSFTEFMATPSTPKPKSKRKEVQIDSPPTAEVGVDEVTPMRAPRTEVADSEDSVLEGRSKAAGKQKSSIEVTEASKPLPKQLGSKGEDNVLIGQIRALLAEERRLQSKAMDARFVDLEQRMDAKYDGRRFSDAPVSRGSSQPQSEKPGQKAKRIFSANTNTTRKGSRSSQLGARSQASRSGGKRKLERVPGLTEANMRAAASMATSGQEQAENFLKAYDMSKAPPIPPIKERYGPEIMENIFRRFDSVERWMESLIQAHRIKSPKRPGVHKWVESGRFLGCYADRQIRQTGLYTWVVSEPGEFFCRRLAGYAAYFAGESPGLANAYTQGLNRVAPKGLESLAQKNFEGAEQARKKRQKTAHLDNPPGKAKDEKGQTGGKS